MFISTTKFLIHCSYYVYVYIACFLHFVHAVLPFGLDVGLLGVSVYYLTRLKKPHPSNVLSVFGPMPGSKESEDNPERVVSCIAHRGAALDAPENTLEAFKYCVEHDCNFIELDVRTSRDGKLMVIHDQGLERLTDSGIRNVQMMDWDSIKDLDVGANHPNRKQFKEVKLCLLDDALDYLLKNKVRMIIDVKGDDHEVVKGVLGVFSARPALYECAAVTCFNPFQLYLIRKRDPQIVGAISFRPYCFSAQDYDAETGPANPRCTDDLVKTAGSRWMQEASSRSRFGENLPLHGVLRVADFVHSILWRWSARWCSVSAVLLHKDIVSPSEVHYWKSLGVRCIGWPVNRPVEKLYWRGVLKSPYLANTLLGEPDVEKRPKENESDIIYEQRAGPLVDKILEPERKMSTGQN